MNGKRHTRSKKKESKRKRKTKNHIPESCIVVASKLMISVLFLLRESLSHFDSLLFLELHRLSNVWQFHLQFYPILYCIPVQK